MEQDDDNATFQLWRSLSNFTDAELHSYIAYYKWQDLVNTKMLIVQRIIRGMVAIIGLIGTIFEIIILQTNKEFKTPSFTYHKFIACFDFMVTLGSVILTPYHLLNPSAYYDIHDMIAMWVRGVHSGFFNFASFGVKLALSLERIVAVWLPQTFGKINNYKVVAVAVVLSMLHGCEYLIEFWIPVLNGIPAYVTFIKFRATLQLTIGFCLTISSIIVAAGLLNLTRKQAKVHDAIAARKKAFRNRQLVYLSLSCSIPLFIDSAMFGCTTLANALCNHGSFVCGLGIKALQLSYDEAMNKAYLNLVGNGVLTVDNIIWTIGEAGHFYLYCILCTPFRNAAIQLFENITLKVKGIVVQHLQNGRITAATTVTTSSLRNTISNTNRENDMY